MKIIGCDFHPSFQQIAMLDLETGEITKKKLLHASGEAAESYRSLQGEQVRVGIEATGSTRWFERLLEELGAGASDGRCGEDPRELRAPAKDGRARRRSVAAVAGAR